ncbi:MAG: hypothetical protein ACRDM7_01340 [Thermoleophilaceae bacterium]
MKNAPKTLLVIGVMAGAALVAAPIAPSGTPDEGEDDGRSVRGAGTTIVEGGAGPPAFTPIITKVAFHWQAGSGRFECLALAPSADAGKPGSGKFDTNIMYVTGAITSADIDEHTAVLTGTATVTGAGAGSDQAFTATVARGGSGATLVLEVSGLTFREILLEGRFRF